MKKMFLALCLSFVSSHVMGADPSTTQATQETIQRLKEKIAENKCPWTRCLDVTADISNDRASRVCYLLVRGTSGGTVEMLNYFDRLRPGDQGECARLVQQHRKLRIVQALQEAERK